MTQWVQDMTWQVKYKIAAYMLKKPQKEDKKTFKQQEQYKQYENP